MKGQRALRCSEDERRSFLGALHKTVSTGGVMNETHFSVFYSVLNRTRGKPRGTVSLPRLAMLSTRCFSLKQETLDTHITGFD